MIDFQINRFFAPGVVPHPPRGAVREFHRSLPGYGVTPLHRCDGLARALGLASILVKDESPRFGLEAFKALGASWAMERLRNGGSRSGTVTTATDGNHGRAVAWAARRLGCEAVIFIPAHSAPSRVEKIRSEGARVEMVPGTYDEAVALAEESARRNGWQVVSDTGYAGNLEVPLWIAEGYSTLFEEAAEQIDGASLPPTDVVLVQAGVGSLMHAAVDHFRAHSRQPRIVAVEPGESDPLFASITSPDGSPTPSAGKHDSIMAGLNCGAVSLAAWPTVRRGVDLFLTVDDRHAAAAMRALARPAPGDPPIVAGESGAAGLAGLLALLEEPELAPAARFLQLGPATNVLVINTEGTTDPVGYARIVDGEP